MIKFENTEVMGWEAANVKVKAEELRRCQGYLSLL